MVKKLRTYLDEILVGAVLIAVLVLFLKPKEIHVVNTVETKWRDTIITLPAPPPTIIQKTNLVPVGQYKNSGDSVYAHALLVERDSLRLLLAQANVKQVFGVQDSVTTQGDTVTALCDEINRGLYLHFRSKPRTDTIRYPQTIIKTNLVEPQWGIGITAGVGIGKQGINLDVSQGWNTGVYVTVGITRHLVNF